MSDNEKAKVEAEKLTSAGSGPADPTAGGHKAHATTVEGPTNPGTGGNKAAAASVRVQGPTNPGPGGN